MAPLTPGESLDGRYTLVRRLGGDGTAEVWLVRDGELGEEIAAKILPPDAAEPTVELLRRECRVARRLVHPNIVRVFDFHRGHARSFITMDHVPGETAEKLRAAAPTEILPVAIRVADALAHAHALGVVHRDVKVSNVLLDEGGVPHLSDFGIAGLLDDGATSIAGGGSRFSVSPQQLEGREPSTADDLYGFGVLLYELISGRPPFWPELTPERVRDEVPAPPSSSHALPQRLLDLVSALLAKAPEDRPASMAAVRDELRAVAGEMSGRPAAEPGAPAKLPVTPPPKAKPIRPLVIRAETSRPATRERTKRRGWAWLLAAAVVLPGAAAVATFYLLPHRTDTRPPGLDLPKPADVDPAPQDPTAGKSGISMEDARKRAYELQRIEETLSQADELHRMLEDKGADLWATEAFQDAEATLRDASARFDAGDHERARAVAGEALGKLESLEGQMLPVFQQAVADGQRGLAEGDASAAESAFGLAARIAPGSEMAESGLRRARSLDDVMELLESGRLGERAGRWAEAEASYRRAVELDPMSRAAQKALARVQARMSDDAFARSMSDGLEALERDEFAEARKAFGRADKLRPGSAQVSDALQQVKQAEGLKTIAGHRDRAVAFEKEERWREAAEQYDAVLKLDPTIKFAQHGRSRTLTRASLLERLAFHLGHPERLSSDDVLEEARSLLVEAHRISTPGPKHRAQVEALDQLIRRAEQPRRVVLRSDGLTQVTVYRKGRLGTFQEHALELRPGYYTVVGTRRGYRDVRFQLVVEAGADPEPLVVICEEEI